MTTTDARYSHPDGTAGPLPRAARTPPARRLAPPRWRDRRLLLGVVLVLAAVLLGARLLAAGNRTAAVLVAARQLAAGAVLTAGDLRTAQVRLDAVGGRYWPAADAPGLQGHPLLTAVAAGDLLARSAVGATATPQPTRIVSLPVDPARLPPLSAGDRVDVFATTKGVGSAAAVTVAILRGAEYVGGGDTGGAGTVTVRLRIAVAATGALVSASETASIDVVLEQPAGDDTGDVGSAPILAGPTAGAR